MLAIHLSNPFQFWRSFMISSMCWHPVAKSSFQIFECFVAKIAMYMHIVKGFYQLATNFTVFESTMIFHFIQGFEPFATYFAIQKREWRWILNTKKGDYWHDREKKKGTSLACWSKFLQVLLCNSHPHCWFLFQFLSVVAFTSSPFFSSHLPTFLLVRLVLACCFSFGDCLLFCSSLLLGGFLRR